MRTLQKALRFPLSGVAKNATYRDTTYPSEERAYSTPMAMNVVGTCAFDDRRRGGSRPGLRRFTGTQPSESTKGMFCWPNGGRILWSDGKKVSFSGESEIIIAPDGSTIVNPHEQFTVLVTKGAIPQTCTAMAFYRDRLVVAGGEMWYASRTGDHGDFDYGGDADDVTRAVAGSVANAGRKGEAITALAAFADSRLFVATTRSLRAIVGEPTSAMSLISENVGIISRDAWCSVNGNLFFIGANGLYGFSDEGLRLASDSIPEDLKGLTSALLVYDPDPNGIHIFTSAGDWFYELETGAFWPVSYPVAKRPTLGATCVIGGINRVIFKCADDVWRYWDAAQATDDGTDINSKVAIGPFKCGMNDDTDGMLAKLTATLAEGSQSVTISVFTGYSAEEAHDTAALGTSPEFSFVATEGWNRNIRPRVRGAWAVLVLSAAGRWAYESILAETKLLGGLRNG